MEILSDLPFCKNPEVQDFPGGWLSGKDPPASAGNMVQSIVWEDPTRLRETKPLGHNC